MYEIYSMLKINTAEQRHQRHCGVSFVANSSGIFIFDFEQSNVGWVNNRFVISQCNKKVNFFLSFSD